MRRLMRPLAAAAVAAAGLMAMPALHAQAQTTPPGKSAAPAANIPDHKLDAAAQAIQKVAKVSQDYQQQIAQAPEPQKERIAKEANTAMVKAVTDQGLSVDEYNSIVDVAQRDPAVHEKIIQRLKTTTQ
jgi:Rieske Fe-S protein